MEPPVQGVDHSVELTPVVLLGANHPSASSRVLDGPAGLISGHRRTELDDPAVYFHTSFVEHLQEVFRLVPICSVRDRGLVVDSHQAMHGVNVTDASAMRALKADLVTAAG